MGSGGLQEDYFLILDQFKHLFHVSLDFNKQRTY